MADAVKFYMRGDIELIATRYYLPAIDPCHHGPVR
jgi:hypothetical protein